MSAAASVLPPTDMAIIMMIAMPVGDETFVPRRIDLEPLLARRSVMLFGPRQTGKSTYVRRQLSGAIDLSFSLLDQGLLTAVLADPTRVRREIEARGLRGAEMLNYSNVARDAQVPRQTVVQWCEVLRDTLIAFELPAWTRTVRRKAVETARFYFFDTGVVRALRRMGRVVEGSADFGPFFEHYVFLELRAWIDYRRPRTPLAWWRSRSGYEVDFILDDRVAIEAKAARRVQPKHLRSLRALGEERLVERSIVVCREERPRVEQGVEIWPLEFFLAALWDEGL